MKHKILKLSANQLKALIENTVKRSTHKSLSEVSSPSETGIDALVRTLATTVVDEAMLGPDDHDIDYESTIDDLCNQFQDVIDEFMDVHHAAIEPGF